MEIEGNNNQDNMNASGSINSTPQNNETHIHQRASTNRMLWLQTILLFAIIANIGHTMTVKSNIAKSHQALIRQMDTDRKNQQLHIEHTIEQIINRCSREQMQDVKSLLTESRMEFKESMRELKSDMKDAINNGVQISAAAAREISQERNDHLMVRVNELVNTKCK